MPEVSNYGIWENVCTRCQSALREMKIAPPEPEEGARSVSLQAPRRLPWLLLISAFVYAADQLTKKLVSAHVPLGGSIPVIDGVFRISHWTNEGAAFSLFADSASPNTVRWALVAFTALASLAVLAALVWLGSRISSATVALALILGGALGNLHDRIAYGSVIDFLEVHIVHYHWPDFNIADSAVVIGACLLLLDSLLPKNRAQRSEIRDQKIPNA